MADTDPQQELKKRARRRLVGALAMALAAAILLPIIMDGEPKPSGNDLQIRIPSQEGSNFTARSIQPTPSAVSAVIPVDQSKPLAQASAPVVTQSQAAKEVASAASKPVVSGSIGADSSKPKTSSSEVQAKPATEGSGSKKPEAHPRDDVRAQAILEDRPIPASREDKGEVFFVQLGVYRDPANAKEIQTKASEQGFKTSLEKAGTNTRVKSAPFRDRASAEAMLAKLKQSGLSGFVVTK